MFSKPLNQVTCEDVRAFLSKKIKEGKNIDYKLDFPSKKEKIPKTIAAFANTTGGIILFGVEEESEQPKEPFSGLDHQPDKKLGTLLTQYALEVIPVPFTETHVCVPDANNRTFGIIQVPQSSLAPHHLVNDRAIYVRTGESARPEDVIHPDKIPWLFEHRQRSVNLRRTLITQAHQRFENCYPKPVREKVVIRSASIMPLYPEEPLFQYEYAEALLSKIAHNHDYQSFQKRSITGGIMFCRQPSSPPRNLDFLQFVDAGLLYSCGSARLTPDGQRLNPYSAVSTLCQMILGGSNLHRETGYWGPLLFQYILQGTSLLEVHPFTNTYQDHYYHFENIVDNEIRVEFSIPASAIEDNALELAMHCSKQLLWALGLHKVTPKELAEAIRSKECLPRIWAEDKDVVQKLIAASANVVPEANFSPAI